MNGYIYKKNTRAIATKINNVIACNDTTIKGDGIAVLGTGEYVVTDMEFNVGDTVPLDIVDRRTELSVLSTQ